MISASAVRVAQRKAALRAGAWLDCLELPAGPVLPRVPNAARSRMAVCEFCGEPPHRCRCETLDVSDLCSPVAPPARLPPNAAEIWDEQLGCPRILAERLARTHRASAPLPVPATALGTDPTLLAPRAPLPPLPRYRSALEDAVRKAIPFFAVGALIGVLVGCL
ncbi:MAG TPA: hypothetical protein VFQ42_22520 [Mycobacterium sp.]|nr:hypothetical protein [Mycobacterium sp.]